MEFIFLKIKMEFIFKFISKLFQINMIFLLSKINYSIKFVVKNITKLN